MDKRIADFYRNKKVLVTGAGGLIGTAFVAQLLEWEACVRGTQHQRRVPRASEIEIIHGDLRDPVTAREACAGMDMVVQAAGVSGGSKQVTVDPIPMFTQSLLINTVMLEAARLSGVRRYLFLSNSSVYAQSEGILSESDAWEDSYRGVPENETGWVKRIGETQCALYGRTCDMQITIVRAGNAYGPHDNFDLESSHVVPALIRKAVEKQNPYQVWGDGNTRRDFIHTEDIARAGLMLAEDGFAQPVNIATGQIYTIKQVVEMICDLVGLPRDTIVYQNDAPPASPAKQLDISRMNAFGFKPRVDLKDGLAQTIAWYRRQRGFDA